MNSLDQLKLLMWKYLQYRKYYRVLTLAEICSPILLVYAVIMIIQSLFDLSPIQVPGHQGSVVALRGRWTYEVLFFTPDIPEVRRLMENVKESRRRYAHENISIKAMPSENEMVLAISTSKKNVSGVVVLKLTNTLFHYKIRDKNLYNTSEKFFQGEYDDNPSNWDYYSATGFLSLLIELNWMYARDRFKAVGIEKPIPAITLAPFPYPPYIKASSSRIVLPTIMGFIIVFTSLIITGPLLYAIVLEKQCGMKELMKIVGIPEKLLWFSWFLSCLIIGIIVCTGITFLLKINLLGANGAVFSNVNTTVLATCILLFYIAQIAFSFVFAAIFQTVVLALPSLFVATITGSFMAYQFHRWGNSIFVHLSCLVPAGAFMQGIIRFAHYEKLGVQLPWKLLFANEVNAPDASVGFVFLLMIFDSIVCLFLTYYISAIMPNPYGFKKSPFFLFTKENRRKLSTVDMQRSQDGEEAAENPFVETPSPDAEVSIGLKRLRKDFGYVQAVKEVNLNLYKNEILVLLGHNGAGKTTTLSMITGLTQPTGGQILFKGNTDLLRNMNEFRKNLGICPQKDSLFPYLSVIDHLLFFGMLRGATEAEAKDEAQEYLNLMDIKSNADDMVAVASKGMKRKLSLSMALMGKADVLILDEPTAGLDPKSKIRVGNLIMKLKLHRTVILTTQFMQEAEKLADRIAIMNHGLVVANGSLEFLKKTFGVGYHLKLLRKKIIRSGPAVKDGTPQLIDLIIKVVPGSKLETRSLDELVFSLPSRETAKFPALIRGLESKKSVLNIERLIMSGLTLEQMFHKLGGASVYDVKGKFLMPSPSVEERLVLPEEKMVGWNLTLLQQEALFTKKLLYLKRNVMTFVFRVALPTILMMLLIRGTTKFDFVDPPLELTLKGAYPGSLIIILANAAIRDDNYHFMNAYVNYIRQMGARVETKKGRNMASVLLKYANESISSYRRELIIASEVSIINGSTSAPSTKISSYHNTWVRHAYPLLYNIIDVSLIHSRTQNEHVRIVPVNHPVKSVNESLLADKFNTREQAPILWVWFILLAFFTIDLLDYFVIPMKVERINGFKQIQLLSSVSLCTYWINNFIFDFILFFMIMVLRVLVFNPFDSYDFFSFKHYDLYIVLLVISCFIASGLLFIYVISFALSYDFGSYIFFFLFNIMCAFISLTYYRFQTALLSGSFTSSAGHVILFIAKYVIMLVPPLNFSLTIEKYIMAWRVNHLAEAYAQQGLEDKQFKAEDYQPYLQTTSIKNPNGILEELCFLVIDIAVYSGILYVIESGIILKYINSAKYKTEDPSEARSDTSKVPSDVLAERENVAVLSQVLNANPTATSETVLLVQGLQKIFERLLRRSVTAVNDATFMIRAGECFGVLGRSGAGKTTTFKMLTGEIMPTRGESWILNVKLSENRTEYFSKTGYCAETNCFLEELTGKETLNLIASLRGVSVEDREVTVDKWISLFGLEPVENKKCGQFSGGNRRKICTALAMIGDPEVVFLDEPTSGIDPVSRRQLYNVLNQAKSSGQTIALACHSMEECEALCDRFTVLVKGEMKFIGTAEDLKQKYGIGFSLIVKLTDPSPVETNDIRDEQIEILKKEILGKFKPESCKLKEEAKSSLRYRIKHKMPLADSFQMMEEVRKNQKIIAEYFLTEISLEDVFISFIEETT